MRGWWLVGLFAAALGFLLYVNTLGHKYCLDDFSSIKENWVVKGGLKNLDLIFSKEYRYGSWNSPGSLYRPIPLTLFAWHWQTWPDNPLPGHLTNVLLYALTGWLLWVTWRRILAAYPPAMTAIAVLVFMAHPVHTEVVANIKSVDEIMALLLCTLSLYSIWRYFEKENIGWLVLAVASYGVALFSKESAITFLAIFPLTIWFFNDKPAAQNLKISALMLIPATAFLLARQQVMAAQTKERGKEVFSVLDNFMMEVANQGERLASAFMMCWRYLQTLIFPHPLISDLGYPQMKVVTFADWRALLGFVVYVGMGVWALLNLKKKHFLSFAILFYLITFSLFSNVLITIGTSYGERLLYAPSLGFALAVGFLFCKIFKINDLNQIWNPNGKGAALWGAVGILLIAYSAKTISRNPAWFDSASLYAADIGNSPNCAKLNYHHALELVKQGMDESSERVKDSTSVLKGIELYAKAIQLYPEYHDAYGSRGLAYFRLKKYDQAFADYQQALKYRPGDSKVLSNMGFIYFLRNQLDEAEKVYREAVKYDPRFVDARRNLGAVLAMKENHAEAIKQWEEALKIEPQNLTLLQYLGQSCRKIKQPAESIKYLKEAEKIDPKNSLTFLYLGLTHSDLREMAMAEKYWKQALQYDPNPNSGSIKQSIGIGYQEAKQPAEAIKYLNEALQADPKNVMTLLYLGLAYNDLGQLATAENYWNQALYFGGANNVMVLQKIGAVYKNAGKPAQAKIFFDRAAQLGGK